MESLERLQKLFVELFQLDLAELDFGLYRLLNLKRQEVEAFLNQQLPAQVDEAFAAVTAEAKQEIEEQIQQVVDEVRTQLAPNAIILGGDIAEMYRQMTMPMVRELIARYDETRQRAQALQVSEGYKAEVFHHLVTFFSRYYDDGDFIPHRRYGADEAYAVPYAGDEVFFHWANRDQHYVKNAERFQDYRFKVRDLTGEYQVRFALTEASVPKDDVKGDRRFFFPRPDAVGFDAEGRVLTLPFEYRLPTAAEVATYRTAERAKYPDQALILERSVPGILAAVPNGDLRAMLAADQRNEKDMEDGKPELPLVLKRMRHFARRNTTDYFVHRNLRGFLQRELEFYIKDQVLQLADVEADLEAKRRLIRVVRSLAGQVIEFLAQIEDTEKLLFEKQKFVLDTAYLVPIQHVPRPFWPEIVANERQQAEWRDWLALEPQKDLFNPQGEMNEAFLEAHPTLPVHTKHFSPDFTRRLLEALPFEDLDEATDGLLVHGENYQALRLLAKRYAGQVHCTYIDPPYNTGKDGFTYKDNYQHASWLAMVEERVRLGRAFLSPTGVLFMSIDRNEGANLYILLCEIFGRGNAIGEIVWRNARDNNPTRIAIEHEFIYCFARDAQAVEPVWRNRFADAKELLLAEYHRLKGAGLGLASIQHRIRQFIRDNRALLAEVDRYKFVDEHGIYTGSQSVHNPHPGGYEYEILHPVTQRPMHRPANGYRFPEETMKREFIDRHRLIYGPDERRIVQIKLYLEEYEDSLRSVVDLDGRLGAYALNALFGRGVDVFENPKPPELIKRLVSFGSDPNATVLDYFVGAASTVEATMEITRQTGARVKCVVVEMAGCFDDVLLPRTAKLMYTPEWRTGQPTRPATAEEAQRTPRLVKIVRLESFEDALHNIATEAALQRIAAREAAYRATVGAEAYRLRYLVRLPVDAAETMLDLLKLEHPFDYTLEVLTDDGPQQRPVDLMETFNYLYGLRVRRLETWVNGQDTTPHDQDGRLYRVVKASDREQRKHVLVIWRDMTGYRPELERPFLEAKVQAMANAGEIWDEMFLNVDSATPGFQSLDQVFKHLVTAGEEG